ncbi:MAG TPA: pyridoxamine 5'-phosphate oxidase family protein [Sphingomicrobium sp.]|nr:pyridoxamine 5'-phosphate oxidase family protein [Sphingomicrobium sp.]
MEEPALSILGDHRIMAISTVRPDGWPQTTIVGYANEGWAIYFMIFRSSQKFTNIERDNRVSVAISGATDYLSDIKAVYAGAHAFEVTDAKERERAWKLLMDRHPNLADFGSPDLTQTALMRAICKHVSVLDYSKGIGHCEALTLSTGDDKVLSSGGVEKTGAP